MGRSELSMLSVDTSNGSSLMKALAVWPTEWVRHNSRSRANSRLPSERRATRSRRAPSKLVGKLPWRRAEAQGTANDFFNSKGTYAASPRSPGASHNSGDDQPLAPRLQTGAHGMDLL